LENEIELCELFSSFNDSLVGNENATIELRSEITDELFPTLHVFVEEYMFKIV
jgi:hypothetical protein